MTQGLIEPPEWAEAGLVEATRLSDLLVGNEMDGRRLWYADRTHWELEVTSDWLTQMGGAVLRGAQEVVATANHASGEWKFQRDLSGWRVVSWKGEPS